MNRLNDLQQYEKMYSFAEAAELLNLPFGRNKLYKILVEMGLLDEEHMPCESMFKKKYMTYRNKLVPKNGTPHSSVIPFFTERGLSFIEELLQEKGVIS